MTKLYMRKINNKVDSIDTWRIVIADLQYKIKPRFKSKVIFLRRFDRIAVHIVLRTFS